MGVPSVPTMECMGDLYGVPAAQALAAPGLAAESTADLWTWLSTAISRWHFQSEGGKTKSPGNAWRHIWGEQVEERGFVRNLRVVEGRREQLCCTARASAGCFGGSAEPLESSSEEPGSGLSKGRKVRRRTVTVT